jgi:urease accessory protein
MNSYLLSLLQISDPTLPIGGYAHSAGLETYVQLGVVNNKITANEFITEMLTRNLQYTDAAFVSMAFDAAAADNIANILQLDSECTAVKLPKEIRQASQKLAIRLIKIFQPVIKNELADQYKAAIDRKESTGNYCIAFGLYAAALGIKKLDVLTGFYYNAAAGMVTNCVKLIPLGQQDGQEILFSLQHLINQLVEKTMVPDKDLVGLCCTGFDIRCMQHEQLYSRLYMS